MANQFLRSRDIISTQGRENKYLSKSKSQRKLTQGYAAAAAKSLQSCPTLCNPRDGSTPGSTVPEIHQARTLEWVAISFSNAWKWKVKVKLLSHARLPATPWTAAHQAPLSMGFSRQECWSGVPLPSPDTRLYYPTKSRSRQNKLSSLFYISSLTVKCFRSEFFEESEFILMWQFYF